jgi:hypothetical protein
VVEKEFQIDGEWCESKDGTTTTLTVVFDEPSGDPELVVTALLATLANYCESHGLNLTEIWAEGTGLAVPTLPLSALN